MKLQNKKADVIFIGCADRAGARGVFGAIVAALPISELIGACAIDYEI